MTTPGGKPMNAIQLTALVNQKPLLEWQPPPVTAKSSVLTQNAVTGNQYHHGYTPFNASAKHGFRRLKDLRNGSIGQGPIIPAINGLLLEKTIQIIPDGLIKCTKNR
jgi:hypothetical protein